MRVSSIVDSASLPQFNKDQSLQRQINNTKKDVTEPFRKSKMGNEKIQSRVSGSDLESFLFEIQTDEFFDSQLVPALLELKQCLQNPVIDSLVKDHGFNERTLIILSLYLLIKTGKMPQTEELLELFWKCFEMKISNPDFYKRFHLAEDHLTEMTEKVTKKLDQLRGTSMTCIQCNGGVVGVLYIPCGHCVVCRDCRNKRPVEHCEACKVHIDEYHQIFL